MLASSGRSSIWASIWRSTAPIFSCSVRADISRPSGLGAARAWHHPPPLPGTCCRPMMASSATATPTCRA
jgi:hypothetical protein